MMEEQMEVDAAPLAFREKCEPNSEMHWRYMQAAQYSDEWVELKSGGARRNKTVGRFTSYYICRSGSTMSGSLAEKCWSIIPSKDWMTRFDDPLASKQRWYCPCCSAKYKATWGMLIEILADGQVVYVLADCPDTNCEDVRAMYLEAKHKPKDPEDLYEKVKHVMPFTTNLIRKMNPNEQYDTSRPFNPRVYKFTDPDVLETIPKFSWHQIFNFDPSSTMLKDDETSSVDTATTSGTSGTSGTTGS